MLSEPNLSILCLLRILIIAIIHKLECLVSYDKQNTGYLAWNVVESSLAPIVSIYSTQYKTFYL